MRQLTVSTSAKASARSEYTAQTSSLKARQDDLSNTINSTTNNTTTNNTNSPLKAVDELDYDELRSELKATQEKVKLIEQQRSVEMKAMLAVAQKLQATVDQYIQQGQANNTSQDSGTAKQGDVDV